MYYKTSITEFLVHTGGVSESWGSKVGSQAHIPHCFFWLNRKQDKDGYIALRKNLLTIWIYNAFLKWNVKWLSPQGSWHLLWLKLPPGNSEQGCECAPWPPPSGCISLSMIQFQPSFCPNFCAWSFYLHDNHLAALSSSWSVCWSWSCGSCTWCSPCCWKCCPKGCRVVPDQLRASSVLPFYQTTIQSLWAGKTRGAGSNGRGATGSRPESELRGYTWDTIVIQQQKSQRI